MLLMQIAEKLSKSQHVGIICTFLYSSYYGIASFWIFTHIVSSLPEREKIYEQWITY